MLNEHFQRNGAQLYTIKKTFVMLCSQHITRCDN